MEIGCGFEAKTTAVAVLAVLAAVAGVAAAAAVVAAPRRVRAGRARRRAGARRVSGRKWPWPPQQRWRRGRSQRACAGGLKRHNGGCVG